MAAGHVSENTLLLAEHCLRSRHSVSRTKLKANCRSAQRPFRGMGNKYLQEP